MSFRLAIHEDLVIQGNGERQSFSDRWIELARQNKIEVELVRHTDPEVMARLAECDGFMWRFGFTAREIAIAMNFIPAIEHGLGIPVYPNHNTMWHFENKIAQSNLLAAAGIPNPETRVFWDRDAAESYCRNARYPLVAKLSNGFQSANVTLLRSPTEAGSLIKRLFTVGAYSLKAPQSSLQRVLGDYFLPLRGLLKRSHVMGLQGGYLYLQEFLPGNDFDTRITVIGDRAFGFRRFNRDNDFRASGSGKIDWNPNGIEPGAIEIAFRVARALNTQSLAIDVLQRNGELVVAEISYTYAAWAVRDCPGHWVRDPTSGEIGWREGSLRPEDAIFEELLDEVKAGSAARRVQA